MNHPYATRESHFRPSAVRAVFETAMRPDVLSLAGGNPELSFLPHQHLVELAAKAATDKVADVFQYGSGAGTDELRETCLKLMAMGGANPKLENIQITSGSQAGLDAVTKVLCDPGDAIIVEAPTYVGALGIFGAYEVEVAQVELDSQGLDPQKVAAKIKELQARGKRVRYVYSIPTHSNPAGISLAASRRESLIEVCRENGVWLIEDDAYGLINFPDENGESVARGQMLAALDADTVIHLGSFSKIFSPGLRLGWVAAPASLRQRLQIACESVCITPSVLGQYLAANYVATPLWQERLEMQCATYLERYRVVASEVEKQLGDRVSATRPSGGFFTWLTLKEPVDNILERAINRKVVVVPGSGCYGEQEIGCHIRLAYSAIAKEDIPEAVERLVLALGD